MRSGSLWRTAAQRLEQAGIRDAALEAEVLIRHVLEIDRSRFFAGLADSMSPDHVDAIGHLLERRAGREPLAYITGSREFYGLSLEVDPRVLIPRQETELLVDLVIEIARKRRAADLVVADIGTGSGAVAIAIASHLPGAIVYATDLSADALEVADANVRRHDLAERVIFRQGDLLDALDRPVDVIASNLPYIRSPEMPRLAPEVRGEPSAALDGGPDGLLVIRRLLAQAPTRLRPGGHVLLEIDPSLVEPVRSLAHECFPGADVSFADDLLGLPRVAGISQYDVAIESHGSCWPDAGVSSLSS